MRTRYCVATFKDETVVDHCSWSRDAEKDAEEDAVVVEETGGIMTWDHEVSGKEDATPEDKEGVGV